VRKCCWSWHGRFSPFDAGDQETGLQRLLQSLVEAIEVPTKRWCSFGSQDFKEGAHFLEKRPALQENN
jgi:hypothetical protein